MAASSSASSNRGHRTPPRERALVVARRRSARSNAENKGRQRSASSAGATRNRVPRLDRSRSRSSELADVLVASATRLSFQSDSAERAVEAIEPASRSGVSANATRRSEALGSSTTLARPMYSDGSVRFSRVSSVPISPPRSRSHTASPVRRLDAARYQCDESPRLPGAVKWSASSAAVPHESTASSGFHVAGSRPSSRIQAWSRSSGANTATGPIDTRTWAVSSTSSCLVEVATAASSQPSSVGTTTVEVLPER